MGPKSLTFAVEIGDGWVGIGNPASTETGSTYKVVKEHVAILDGELSRQG